VVKAVDWVWVPVSYTQPYTKAYESRSYYGNESHQEEI